MINMHDGNECHIYSKLMSYKQFESSTVETIEMKINTNGFTTLDTSF